MHKFKQTTNATISFVLLETYQASMSCNKPVKIIRE